MPKNSTIILIAASVVQTDTLAMTRAISRAIKHLSDVFVLVRMHPANPLPKDAWEEIERAVGPSNLRQITASDNIYEIIAASDVVVTGGSTLAFEAMVLGAPPVLFKSDGDFSASSFEPFGHALFIANNAESLVNSLQAIRNRSNEWTKKIERWPQLIREVFGDINADRNAVFRSALETLMGIHAK
jgi:CDP-glycerol glycerophosphotransferase (TagB/SpsB family)